MEDLNLPVSDPVIDLPDTNEPISNDKASNSPIQENDVFIDHNSLPTMLPNFIEKVDDEESKDPKEAPEVKELPENLDPIFNTEDKVSEKKPVETKEVTEAPTANDDNASDLAQLYYDNLVKNGVYDLPDDFEFDGTFEGLRKAQEYTDKVKTDKIKLAVWNRMPEELKPVVEYGLSGGTDINDFVKALQETNVPNFDISTTNGQESLIKYYYENKGVSELVAETAINTLDEKGLLEQEAVKILKLVNKDKEQLIQSKIEQAKQSQLQKQQEEAQFMDKTKEVLLSNDNWNNSTKNNIYRSMFAKDEDGITIADRKLELIKSNPAAYAEMINFINHFDTNAKKFDLNKYMGVKKSLQKNLMSNWEKELNNSSALKSKPSIVPNNSKKMDWSKGSFDV